MSRFSLSSDCRCQLICREWYRLSSRKYPGKEPISDMQYHGVGRHHDQWPHALHVVANETMTGQRYIDEVLLPHVRLFRGAIGDLNPIENVWDALGRQVAGRNYPPTNKNTLIRALTEEWDKLPQQLLDNVVQKYERCHFPSSTIFPPTPTPSETRIEQYASISLRKQGPPPLCRVSTLPGRPPLFSDLPLSCPIFCSFGRVSDNLSEAFDTSPKDEVHFWLNGYVNKQNCRIWSEANPQVYVETPLHPEKLTVWCAIWAGGIIDPYFFKNDEGHNVTVNGDRYRAMITNFFIPELNNHDVQELWFQQDGATCHTARDTIDLLKDTFGDRLISRFGLVNWPPRFCDLTPLDYFLWGYVKSLVCADKPQTLDHLEDNIRRVIADIRPQMLEKVIENWTSRLDYIRASLGSPMPEIIFKM
ncbi:transposable element Tc3 transposase [Trichonephila clavipes]|nr:transposable element Tc3 transposase [Trichonephila clavipes]